MTFLPIRLGLSEQAFKGSGEAGGTTTGLATSSVIPQSVRQAVLDRDQCTCQYCGFSSRKYQVVRFKDGKRDANNPDHVVTACIFCDQCFALDQVTAMKSGVLIWLPEMDQAMLHHVARAIYVARISQGSVADAARKLLDVFMARRDEVKARIKTDDPSIISLVLRDYIDGATYKDRDKKLEGVRVFPLDRRIIKEGDLEFNQFPQILAYWRSKDGPFGAFQPNQWLEQFTNLKAAA